MKAKILLVALSAIMHNGITYTPEGDNNTFDCDEQEAKFLIEAGAAQIVQEDDPLLSMTVAELKQLVIDRGVTLLDGVTKKADIIAFLNTPEGHGNA